MNQQVKITDGVHEYQPHTKVYSIDIETVSQGLRANEYTDKKKYKLGNVKDPAKVEAKLKEKREEARNKHALHWSTGKIISVAVVDVYGEEEDEVYYGHDEVEILIQLRDKLNKPCKVIGKSSNTFDVPFIVGRCMSLAIDVPNVLRKEMRKFQYDVDEFFGWSSQSSQRGTLDDYAWGIGYKQKPMDGGAVAGLYNEILAAEAAGNKEELDKLWHRLTEYNLHDSRVVSVMTKRYYGMERRGI